MHGCRFVGRQAEIGKGDTWLEGVGVVGWFGERPCPVSLGWSKPFGMAVVERGVVERADMASVVVVFDGFHELRLRQVQQASEFWQRLGGGSREHRRHKAAKRLLVDNRVRLLVGLSRNQTAPDRIAFRPEILTLIVKPFAIAVDNHAQGHAVDAGTYTAVVKRSPGVDGNHMCLGRVADCIGAKIEHPSQQHTGIEAGAANKEIVRWPFTALVLPPSLP
ncbi:hypothetical protein D3C80_1455320 [compost metagenome]